MNITEAQRDLRQAFVGGGPGTFISGTLWLVAAFVMKLRGSRPAFAVLFFGGMLIFPLSQFAVRVLFHRKPVLPANPLGRIVLESTIAMSGGFFCAWLFLAIAPAYVFPVAAIAVGTHYAAFRTVYGDPVFWILAFAITAVGIAGAVDHVTIPGGPILAVGLIEVAFSIVLTFRAQTHSRRAS